MLIEFPSTFIINESNALVVARLIDYNLATNENPILSSKFEESDTAGPAPNHGDGSNDDDVNAPDEYFSDGEVDENELENVQVIVEETQCVVTHKMS